MLAPSSSKGFSYATIDLALSVEGRTHEQPSLGSAFLGNADSPDNAKLDFGQGGIETATQFVSVDQTFVSPLRTRPCSVQRA